MLKWKGSEAIFYKEKAARVAALTDRII